MVRESRFLLCCAVDPIFSHYYCFFFVLQGKVDVALFLLLLFSLVRSYSLPLSRSLTENDIVTIGQNLPISIYIYIFLSPTSLYILSNNIYSNSISMPLVPSFYKHVLLPSHDPLPPQQGNYLHLMSSAPVSSSLP